MERFIIKYNNKESNSDGKTYLVRESKDYPHHYLISDGESHIGGGTLAKKYCVRIEESSKNGLINDLLTLAEVNRDISKETKPTLMTMTEFQKFKVDNSCFYCRFEDLDYNDSVCKKCRSENKSDQYYG